MKTSHLQPSSETEPLHLLLTNILFHFQTLKWIVAPKRSEFTNVLRITGCKIKERGLAKRLVAEWRIRLALCRTSILAESVTISDVAPLLAISFLGVVLSFVFLAMEILLAKWRKKEVVCCKRDFVVNGVAEAD